jgi:acetylornithine/succinyldiaminopimelate/putrescine aminotransferase
MIGVELATAAAPLVGKCMEQGVLVNATHDVVLRLLPAINLTAEQVDEGCAIIERVLRDIASAPVE